MGVAPGWFWAVLLRAPVDLAERTALSVAYAMALVPAVAGSWLVEHNTGGNIMVSPHANQVPSRMILAMGDYSGLQSSEYGQVLNPRDLPPTGPEPDLLPRGPCHR